MGSSSRSLKCKLSCLLNPEQQRKRLSSFYGDRVKIQKVPPYLRQRTEFNKYYFPKVISIGPIHHPKGEEYKEMWATMYLQQRQQEEAQKQIDSIRSEYKDMWPTMYLQQDKLNGQQQQEEAAQKLLDSIRSEIQALKACYKEDVIQGLDDDELAWTLFRDGCATLHVMDKVGRTEPSRLQAPYIIAQQDLLLLENQLPYQVLRILSKNNDSFLKKLTKSFLKTLHIVPQQYEIDIFFYDPPPAHLLDLLIKSILPAVDNIKVDGMSKAPAQTETYWNIQELVAAGFEIQKSNNMRDLTSIYLTSERKLHIPPLTVDDFTAQTLMNMVAYEMCPDSKSKYEISNYVSFLNSLINHAEDVKVLKQAGVVRNLLGSDEKVAQIFNTVCTDLVLETGTYSEVRQKIEDLYTEFSAQIVAS